MKDDNLGESPLPIDDAEDGTIKRKRITKDSEDRGGKTRKVPMGPVDDIPAVGTALQAHRQQ
ncbi:hypothetical protein L484_021465 [Morus notabilis]|uniref:Uncharacterized protein n=1 Tax=Morus notabilis TaxID=981085 RepID=W9SCD6_9ROSA|nr:hypothetical protein L484_021465 [Morus notabilis]